MALTFLTDKDLGRMPTGKGAPADSLVAEVGTLYMDSDTGDVYKCVAVNDGVCVWNNLSKDSEEKVDKAKLTLGRDANGILYLYIDGAPVGDGIELPTGGIDGYITEDKQIIFNNLPDGEYTLAYIMDDGSIVPIGSMEKDSNVYYTVTNTLTNCTSNNSATQAIEGESYSATISANSGYELKSVTVTMGGSPVTVSGVTISIERVTGDIVISATAMAKQTEPTNFADSASDDWQEGYRLSISGGTTSALAGHTTTNYVPIELGDTLSVEGLRITGYSPGQSGNAQDAAKIVVFDKNKTKRGGLYGLTSGTPETDRYGAMVSVNNDISTYTICYRNDGTQTTITGIAYIRLDGFLLDGYTKNDVVINIKHNGEWL